MEGSDISKELTCFRIRVHGIRIEIDNLAHWAPQGVLGQAVLVIGARNSRQIDF